MPAEILDPLPCPADTRMALGPAPSTTKVVVFGGNGFVGSRVCQLLQGTGAKVVSVSRSGGQPEWAAGEDWVGGVEWVKGEACTDDLSGIISGSSAVVSCLGVIGGSDETMRAGNGAANVAIVKQAGTVGRIVYVSVSDEVGKAVGGFALKGYFNGKREAEEAVSTATSSVILAPTFIYGFSLLVRACLPPSSGGSTSRMDILLSHGAAS